MAKKNQKPSRQFINDVKNGRFLAEVKNLVLTEVKKDLWEIVDACVKKYASKINAGKVKSSSEMLKNYQNWLELNRIIFQWVNPVFKEELNTYIKIASNAGIPEEIINVEVERFKEFNECF